MLKHSSFLDITTFIFDVDGVFTDSQVLVMENGDLLRSMNTRDGQAVKMALYAGYNIVIITKGLSEGVRQRFENLGVAHIYDKVDKKASAFEHFVRLKNISKKEVLYLGDDIPDLEIYPLSGISACPADGSFDNLNQADYICRLKGGMGCVREVIEKVMRIQGKWNF
ncbi:MAG: 3-deoxy-D-manno-octulosonate 8-phosphate phosphatase [Saprospiraceae bacterium]|nr:3-deoxy-D-manno-octulosonate 8-phosphate phosphatase [Saprospiraceae bacterium]MBK8548569.1 3-deoxy-D-manno-octulosonate 8-phosphate phosphatase [Saprospiraceae bacterium]